MKKKWLYIWFIPALWVVFSTVSFFYSGDENACFAISAIVGVWIVKFYSFNENLSSLVPILLAGGIVMAILGFVMDLLVIKKKLWLSIFIAGSAFIFISSVLQFDSIEQLRWKHRSVFAPLFMSLNVGIYLAIIFSIIITGLKRIWKNR